MSPKPPPRAPQAMPGSALVSPALPPQDRSVAASGPVKVRRTRQRVEQSTIDKMAEFRRQGVSFQEIGARLECSERTARRYVGNVQPHLVLPATKPDAERDPRFLREKLLTEFLDLLYRDPELRQWSVIRRPVGNGHDVESGGPPSILFMNEAEKQVKEKLST